MAKLITHTRDDVLIVDFEATTIIDQLEVSLVGDELDVLVESAEVSKILVDMNRIDFMSSAMIGELLKFDKKCKAKSITVKFCNLTAEISKLFEMTKLTLVFDVHEKRESALAAFAG